MKEKSLKKIIRKILLAAIPFIFISMSSVNLHAQAEADAVKGKVLFNKLCVFCHKPYKRVVGPALHGITEKRNKEWLYKWIRNSKSLIEAGDPEAVKVFEEFRKIPMNAYPDLSNEDIDNILAYVMLPPKK